MTNDHKTALVVRGGWDGHQPVEATELFIPYLKASGFEIRVEESPKIYADTDYMAGVDLVTQCMTMSTIEKDEFEGLRTAVENGTDLAGWHGGIADSRGHIITTGTDFYRLKTTRQAQKADSPQPAANKEIPYPGWGQMKLLFPGSDGGNPGEVGARASRWRPG